MYRYERKYRIENVDLSIVEQIIRLHPAGLRKIYPDRQINNIYYDTPSLSTYKENVMGIANRKKFRVRWYGYETHIMKNPILEIKNRQNEVGFKNNFEVNSFSFDNILPLTEEVNERCKPLILEPSIQNSYKRAYFGTFDKKFRVTLDWNLSYASLRRTSRFKSPQYKEYNTIILELKYDKELEKEAHRITQHFPFRRTKNSKYVCGVELCW